jgi:hypothetical protein
MIASSGLVPKLQADRWLVRVQWGPHYPDIEHMVKREAEKWTGYTSLYDVSYKRGLNHFDLWAIAESPALALCLAIEKLIDGEERQRPQLNIETQGPGKPTLD